MAMTHMTPGRAAAVFGTAATAVYLTMVFGTLPALQAQAGMMPFDLRPAGYSTDTALALLRALGAEGRFEYLTRQLPLDTFYPALMALTLASLFRLAGRQDAPSWPVSAGIVVSWLAAGFDYAENAFVAAMLLAWPQTPDVLVHMSALRLSQSPEQLALLSLGCWLLARRTCCSMWCVKPERRLTARMVCLDPAFFAQRLLERSAHRDLGAIQSDECLLVALAFDIANGVARDPP